LGHVGNLPLPPSSTKLRAVKTLATIVVIAIAVGAVVYFAAFRSTPERVMCTRLADLCGKKSKLSDLKTCVTDMERVSEKLGSTRFKRTSTCVDKASSCTEAVGCMAGTGLNMMQRFMREFMRGIGKTIFGKDG
jgi:hypothetical protein